MTGWQGGGWNPQQDPYGGGQGGQYGADPYAQYGSDPYPQQGFDPYGQYGGDPYGGGYQPGFEPPRRRSKLPIVLSIVAILAVVGTVLTIVLINRGEEDPAPTAGGSTSSSSKPPSTPKSPSSSGRKLPSNTKKPSGKDGWKTYDLAGGTYQAPPDWTKDATAKRQSGLGVDFTPGAVVGVYDCEGAKYFRGFVAWGDAQSKDGSELDLDKTVTDFAKGFAGEYYRNPQLDAPAPKSTTVDGRKAATITIKLTVQPTKPACEATTGEVALIGYPIEKDGKNLGVRMLVVVNDLAGGPANPQGLPDPLAEEIIGTLTLK